MVTDKMLGDIIQTQLIIYTFTSANSDNVNALNASAQAVYKSVHNWKIEFLNNILKQY